MTTTSEADKALPRPGWPEIIVGLLVLAVLGYGGGSQLHKLGFPPVIYGLIFTALSGVAGLAGFGAAVALRIRSWKAFGIRKVSGRWILIGIGVGLADIVIKIFAIAIYMHFTHDQRNIQDVYALGGSGGVWSLILATLFLGVLTPIGEDLLFRGVVTNALLRYGPFVGVVGGALIFALMHGINPVFPAALVVGLTNSELFRRTGSVWPGVVTHIVFNLPTIPVLVFAASHH